MPRDNQLTAYLDREEVLPKFQAFKKRYPKLNDSQIANAAISFYLSHAERGIDGNLLPYASEDGSKLKPVPLEPTPRLVEVIEQVIASRPQRAEVWTKEQRQSYRKRMAKK
jgi:hypothetical protein